MISNNVTRLLLSRNIPFVLFELPTEKLGAIETARQLNVSPELVFKTIVVVRENKGKPILAIIPGPSEVDLKSLAFFLDEKKLKVPSQNLAEQLTGLQTGGISPLSLINRGFQIILDESALGFKEIHISGGQRGLNVRIPVKDLMKLINARTAPISLLPGC